jgi:hypothetical protein
MARARILRAVFSSAFLFTIILLVWFPKIIILSGICSETEVSEQLYSSPGLVFRIAAITA